MPVVENSQNFQKISCYENDKNNENKKTEEVKEQSFFDFFSNDEEQVQEEDKSTNGKFDIDECINNFCYGIYTPLTAIVEHPIVTAGVVAGTAALCTLVPVMAPVLGIGFGALSVYELGKGAINVVEHYNNGEYDKAEKAFDEVGQGTIGIGLSALGIKQNIKSLKTPSTLSQFLPSNIKKRAIEVYKHFFTMEEVTKIKKEKMPFKETTEGKRRNAMSTEEIKSEVNSLYKEACDEYGIPEGLRPEIEVTKLKSGTGGQYVSTKHKIEINEEAYREGTFDLPDVIKHETTHANEAVLRQRLPMEEKQKIVIDYLLDKIQNGDKDKVVTGEGNIITGSIKVEPPKMNDKMKADFSKLAQDKLYQITDYSNDEFITMVKPLVEANPEFVRNYANIDEAVTAMVNYAKNHNFRYKIAINNAAGFNTSNVDKSLLKELSPEEKIKAIKSFKEGIDCLESNAAGQGGILGLGGDFNQYQFTPEEVLAQQKGNDFEISKLEEQLKNLRANENYDLAEEARLLDQIKISKLTIEYKTKGQEMYKLQTESFNHPEDTKLKEQVTKLNSELSELNSEINDLKGKFSFYDSMAMHEQGKTKDEIMKFCTQNIAFEYSTYTVKENPAIGASIKIPYTTTNTAEIIADNIEKTDN